MTLLYLINYKLKSWTTNQQYKHFKWCTVYMGSNFFYIQSNLY